MQNHGQHRSGLDLLKYIWTEWISTFVILILLLPLTLLIGTGEMIHGQLLRMGEAYMAIQPQVYSILFKAEPAKPECNRQPNVDALVKTQMQANAADEFTDFFGTASKLMCVRPFWQVCSSVKKNISFMMINHATYGGTSAIRAYRNFETTFLVFLKFGTENRAILLIFMVVLAAISATLKIHHIICVAPATKLDYRVYSLLMTLGNGFNLLKH